MQTKGSIKMGREVRTLDRDESERLEKDEGRQYPRCGVER
jgi:hypothetical protein